MRKLLTGLTLVCVMGLFLPAALTLAQDEVQDEAQPSILIEEMRHDMGEVFEQEFYKHSFKVKNVGDADLHIKNVKPG